MTSSTPPLLRDWYDIQFRFPTEKQRRKDAAGDFASFRDKCIEALRGGDAARLQFTGKAYGLFAVMSRPDVTSKARPSWVGPLAKSVEEERRRCRLSNDVAAQGDTHQEVIVLWTRKLGDDTTGKAKLALDAGYDDTLSYLRAIVKNIVRDTRRLRRRGEEHLAEAEYGHIARRPGDTAISSQVDEQLEEQLMGIPAGIFKRPEALYLLGHRRTKAEELAEQMDVDRAEVARKRHELVYLPIREYVRKHHPDWLE